MTEGHDAMPSHRPHAARMLTGAALLVLIGGTTVAQQEASQRPQQGIEEIAPKGTPLNPDPVLTIAPDERLRDDTLYLAVGRVDTSERKTIESLVDAIENAHEDDRMVIQLDGPLTKERQMKLDDAGLASLDYLPTNAFIVRPANADVVKVADLDFIAWYATYETNWKTSPEVGARDFQTAERQELDRRGLARVNVTLFSDAQLVPTLRTLNALLPSMDHHLTETFGTQHVLTMTLSNNELADLATVPEVQFIEEAPEVSFRNATTTWIIQTNLSNQTVIHDRGIRGAGQIVAVSDGRVDVNHCAFSDTNPIGPTHRKIEAYNTSVSSFDTHGTHVAGTAVGDSGAAGDTRGMAYEARMVFNDVPSFSDAGFYNMAQTHHDQGARVHTNSWGNDGTTSYDGLTRGIDRFSYDNEDSLVLFAVTNTTSLRNPENAKNVLAVGASQDTPNQANHCSGGVGPTADGRRKPEIYAPGCSTTSAAVNTSCSVLNLTGTSMASPAVAGGAALVRQYFEDGYYPTGSPVPSDAITPTGALVKATLINSTVDMTGIAGFPSNLEGWGRLLLDNALYFTGEDRAMVVQDVRNVDGLSTGDSDVYGVGVSGASEPLNITLVFTEPPAASGSGAPTINDLNLRVVAPNGDEYRGNVFAGGVSATGGSFDDKNNVESVRIATPQSGEWTVEVVGASVNQGTQGYAIAVNGEVTLGPIPLGLSLNAPLPETLTPGETFDIQVSVAPGDDSLVADSVKAFVADDGVTFDTAINFVDLGGNTFGATIGPFVCDDTPAIFVRAEGASSGEQFASGATMASPHQIKIGETVIFAEDTFETDSGWTVSGTASTGQWERTTPQPTAAQPGMDTTPMGTMCFVTDGTAGSNLGDFDIDGGNTVLVSPTYDLSGLASATVAYNRWYSNSAGANPNADIFRIQVSNNGGFSYTALETIGPSGAGTSGGWIPVEIQLENVIALTDEMVFRFIAEDTGSGSIVEAALDDFRIDNFVCQDIDPVNDCFYDLNNTGAVDIVDFTAFAMGFGSVTGDPNYDPALDYNATGSIDIVDFTEFSMQFGRTDCLP